MMIYIYSILLGLIFGSFANVYFYRFPKELSVIHPFSFCPQCNHSILWYDNIPILSFLWLRGKCRFCQTKISRQYPFVEFLCAVMFVLVAIKFRDMALLTLIGFTLFAFVLFLAGGTDLITYFQFDRQYGIIPDHLIWIIGLGGLMFSPFNPILNDSWRLSLLGAGCGAGIMISLRVVSGMIYKREALGWGDIKLVMAVGFFLGWKGVVTTLLIGSLLGTAISLALIWTKKIERRSALPFGPFLAAGSFAALFF